MSENFPECPSFNHNTCKKFYDPEVCAIARKEEICLWKYAESKKEHTDFKDVVEEIKDKEPGPEDIVEREDKFIVNWTDEPPKENNRNRKKWIFGQFKRKR